MNTEETGSYKALVRHLFRSLSTQARRGIVRPVELSGFVRQVYQLRRMVRNSRALHGDCAKEFEEIHHRLDEIELEAVCGFLRGV